MHAKSLIAGAIVLAVLPFAAARAGAIGPEIETNDNVMVRVSVADLNLDTTAGARTALHRLTVAAREVCSPEPAVTELVRWDRYKTCVRGKVDQAVAELGAPGVAALTRRAPPSPSLAQARP
ncbi:UrcA family protein [Caulobacter sp. KR2-114]|uniref:UrcA family protein n=1 Tax=Caulobacter sp. KR2-114 TaxID=3400912 RepID=UPI003C0D645A